MDDYKFNQTISYIILISLFILIIFINICCHCYECCCCKSDYSNYTIIDYKDDYGFEEINIAENIDSEGSEDSML